MISITKIVEFEAAHYLPAHAGKCKNLHGHSYRLEVTVAPSPVEKETVELEDGMVMDFGDLKDILRSMIDHHFDHQCINDWFSGPTAERMVVWMRDYLPTFLPDDVELVAIRLWETSTSYAEWRKNAD